jgi:hypothetical protein
VNHSFAYTETTYASFERVLVARAPELVEPAPTDAPAQRLLGVLVETLAGVAVGLAAGRVVTAVGREFGAAVRDAIVGELDASLWLPTSPRARGLSSDARGRSLVGELAAVLQPRLCREVPGSRLLVAAIRDALARMVPHRIATFDAMLDRLATDEVAAFRFGEHLLIGWQAFCAALTGTGEAEVAAGSERVRATWRAWRDHATHATRESPEFIVRIG